MKPIKYISSLIFFILIIIELSAQENVVDFQFRYQSGFNRRSTSAYESKTDTLTVTFRDTVIGLNLT